MQPLLANEFGTAKHLVTNTTIEIVNKVMQIAAAMPEYSRRYSQFTYDDSVV